MSGNGTNGTVTSGYGSLASNRAAMDEFLSKMRNSGNVYASCEAAGVSRTTAYRWRKKWATFAAEWNDAKDDAVDRLDLEAWKRATQGRSDRLLMFLLKAHKPDVYNPVQRQVVTGQVITQRTAQELSDAELMAIAALGAVETQAGEGGINDDLASGGSEGDTAT